MIVKAYQTLEDKDNISYVEDNAPFKCTRKDAWLGHGYYLWDSEIEWAHQWGKASYKRKRLNYIIAEIGVNIDNTCFDIFGSVNCQKEFKDVIDIFKKNDKTKDLKDLIVPNIITYMKNLGIFNYNSIRAGDMNNTFKIHFKKQREYTVINQRVQICVLNLKDVIILPVTVVYPK